MAMTASPPPQLPSAANDAYIDQLDDDIARVRAEIANLTKRRSLLSASLLSSTKVLAALESQPNQVSSNNGLSLDTTPLSMVDQQSLHNQINVHRLAFGITAFPFTDPSPETDDESLLGIRFDIPSHNGKFDQAPYYLFCRKISRPGHSRHRSDTSSASTVNKILTVHHHTIPAFVPLQDLLDKYLPSPDDQPRTTEEDADDEGYDSPRSPGRASSPEVNSSNPGVQSGKSRQNIHALASAIYTHLSSHAKRTAAVALLSEPIHPSLTSMSSTGEDCHFVRLIWHDGLVGRLKLSDDGFIERAVVFGDEGRLRDMERLLSQDEVGDQVPIMSLRLRLDEIARRRGRDMEIDGGSILLSER